jgi:signal transduction histidine kinase
MIGLCWAKEYVETWCYSDALSNIPKGYIFEMMDEEDNPLCRLSASGAPLDQGPSANHLSASYPLARDAFNWIVRISPRDPLAIQRLTRRQVYFYSSVLAVLFVVLLTGLGMVVSLALKEMELGRLKADFAANVSHELRTPLALIRAAGDSLSMRRNMDASQVDRYLGIISREGRRLTDLVNTVLSFSDIDKKTEALHFEPTDVCALVKDFLRDYQPQLDDAGFQLESRIPGTSFLASLDPEAIRLVLVNLLDNAIKFSPERKELRVLVEPDNGRIGIRIEDRGIGISPEDREKIFDSFYRGEKNLVKKTRGTGIGLALAHRIVRAHRGEIRVDSTPGKGSVFTVLIPEG